MRGKGLGVRKLQGVYLRSAISRRKGGREGISGRGIMYTAQAFRVRGGGRDEAAGWSGAGPQRPWVTVPGAAV